MSSAVPVAPAGSAEAAAGVRSLYIHVPFCERRCEYCDFASVAGLAGHEEYVAALRVEIGAVAERLPGVELDTVFVGGGTPSLLPPDLLAGILDEVRDGFRLAPGAEVTMEANPSSTDSRRARSWREAGVNRVSLGIQSLHPPALRFLGRVHDAARALAAVEELRSAGIERISTDLIYAVPGLDDDAWSDTLDRVLALGCDHLSAYELTVEPGTPLHRSVARGAVTPVGAEPALRQQRICLDRCAQAGLLRYEISNHARPGQECRHNLAYWANAWYLACGVGAHGHLPPAAAAALGMTPEGATIAAGIRYWHERHPAAYVRSVSARPAAPVAGMEAVSAADTESERVMVGLRRTAEGVALRGPGALAEARALAGEGMLEFDEAMARVRATERGAEVLDALVLRLVEAADTTAVSPGGAGRR